VSDQMETSLPGGSVDKSLSQPPKRSKKKWVIIFLVVVLIVLAGWYFLKPDKKTANTKSEIEVQSQEQEGESDGTIAQEESDQFEPDEENNFPGKLKIQQAAVDKDNTITKTFGPVGDTMSIRAGNGTLYTLTVPPDALILPTAITMSPLKESPIAEYGEAVAGSGVFLDGSFSFIRPAFLTIQPNTSMPEIGKYKAVTWGRCNIGSRGFDPEVCAGSKKLPFYGGVEPGKVVVHADAKEELIVLNPTIPIGETNVWNAHVFRSGAYFADKIGKEKALVLTKQTYSESADIINKSEVLMHLLTLGGDLAPFKEQIDRFEKEKKDYPREVLKTAIIALAVNDKDTYTERIKDFKDPFEKNLSNFKASFLYYPRYAALLIQLEQKRKQVQNFFSKAVKAEEPLDGSWPSELPDFDETARNDTGGSDWEEDMKKRTCSMLRYQVSGATSSCDKKAEAIETLESLCPLDEADKAAIRQQINACANKCKTPEECEQHGDAAVRYEATDAIAAVGYRILAFIEQGMDCTAETKKTLENYGQNFCN